MIRTDRNYKKETAWENQPEQVKERENRNTARRHMMKAGRVHKGDGMDVDHKNSDPNDNSPSNWRVLTSHKNKSMNKHDVHRKAKKVRSRKT